MPILGNFIKGSIFLGNNLKKVRKAKPQKWQEKVLFKLLNKAKFTEVGVAYKFEEISKGLFVSKRKTIYQDFKSNTPIFDYNSIYDLWWHRSRNGEPDIAWPGKVKYFALSSGTSEASSKAIPVTAEMLKAIHNTSIAQIISLGEFRELPPVVFEKSYLMLGGCTELNRVGGHFEGDLSGITTAKIPFWFEKFYKPGFRISQEKNWEKKLSQIVSQAPTWDISFVAGVPAWIQIIFERIIDTYKLKNIHEMWPNLTAFGWGGVSLEPYRASFSKLLDTEKPFFYLETYLASEGFFAYQNEPEKGLKLVLNRGIFFEFIPFNDDNFDEEGNLRPNPETLMVHQTTENTEYAILVSTCAGAWRYLVGDTVMFKDSQTAEIIITGRTKHFMSLCGEHLSVDNLNKAVVEVSKEIGVEINEFTLIGEKLDKMFGHKWYFGCSEIVDKNLLISKIDARLKDLNDDYAVERLHALTSVDAEVLPVNVFYDYMKVQGKIGGQNKFPRVLKGKMQTDWLSFLASTKA